jgi:hypothetical protein
MGGLSVISIYLSLLIKILHRHSYIVIVHHFIVYEHICQHMNLKMQYKQNTYQIITPEMGVTAEMGACFHPTVGVATPSGFTTSHP